MSKQKVVVITGDQSGIGKCVKESFKKMAQLYVVSIYRKEVFITVISLMRRCWKHLCRK